jgi:hypothetical protein
LPGQKAGLFIIRDSRRRETVNESKGLQGINTGGSSILSQLFQGGIGLMEIVITVRNCRIWCLSNQLM